LSLCPALYAPRADVRQSFASEKIRFHKKEPNKNKTHATRCARIKYTAEREHLIRTGQVTEEDCAPA